MFDLLGADENDMTDALAYTLARSPAFLITFAKRLGYSGDPVVTDAVLSLQTRRAKTGITESD